MIIGNGLIAKIFSSYNQSNDILIFSSGVSNSSETSNDEFKREFDLVKSYKDTNMKFIYFSSININIDTKYFNHKKEIENYIRDNFNNYIIFRLPNVVGTGGNSKNMFNYFKKSIRNSEKIIVKDVYRSLLDVDDLKIICDKLMKLKNKIINISYIERLKVIDILNEMSKFLNKSIDIIISNEISSEFNIENSTEVDKILDDIFKQREGYIKKIIEKYGKY